MCKLCNTNLPPSEPKSSKYLYLLEIVEQYIGTYPCRNCAGHIRSWTKTNDPTKFDQYILFKLYRVYVLANFTDKQLVKRRSAQILIGHQKQSVLPGIRQIITKSTGSVSYIVSHRAGPEQQLALGTYPTLMEALQVKVNYMQQHGCKRGLTQLSNKLKELTNEN